MTNGTMASWRGNGTPRTSPTLTEQHEVPALPRVGPRLTHRPTRSLTWLKHAHPHCLNHTFGCNVTPRSIPRSPDASLAISRPGARPEPPTRRTCM